MQKDFKRLLAYSSIANMGYALLAVAAGVTGIMPLLMFFVLYLIDTMGLFSCQMAMNRKGEPVSRIDQMAGLAKTNMPLTIALTALALSVLGMPPFGGFWAKFFVFGAAIHSGLWGFAAAGLVASVIGAFYYLRLIKLMWFDAGDVVMDKMPAEAKWVGYAAAAVSLFAIPLIAVVWPLATNAAKGFGL